jgi:hypothetical protein
VTIFAQTNGEKLLTPREPHHIKFLCFALHSHSLFILRAKHLLLDAGKIRVENR